MSNGCSGDIHLDLDQSIQTFGGPNAETYGFGSASNALTKRYNPQLAPFCNERFILLTLLS